MRLLTSPTAYLSGTLCAALLIFASCKRTDDQATHDRKPEGNVLKNTKRPRTFQSDNDRPPSVDNQLMDGASENAKFQITIREKQGDFSDLIDDCMVSSRDSEKATLIAMLSEAAARAGDSEYLERLLALDPSGLKNGGILAYCKNVIGYEGVSSALSLVSKTLLPEEVETFWEGISAPLARLSSEEIANLFRGGQIPTVFHPQLGDIVGLTLVDKLPADAMSAVKFYPQGMQSAIAKAYWNSLPNRNPMMARKAIDDGVVPSDSKIIVARGVVQQIIRLESLNSSLDYALSQSDPELQKSMAAEIFDQWAKDDVMAASQRATSLPQGATLEGAAGAIALRLEKLGDKTSAKQWRAAAKAK